MASFPNRLSLRNAPPTRLPRQAQQQGSAGEGSDPAQQIEDRIDSYKKDKVKATVSMPNAAHTDQVRTRIYAIYGD